MPTDKEIRDALDGLQSNNDKIRYPNFKFLLPISEKTPEKLYFAWHILVEMLQTDEVSKKWAAINLLGNLIKVDSQNNIELIFDDFFKELAHVSPVVAPHVALAAGKIINAKPHLEPKITPLLLDIDNISHCKQHELLKSYVIEALDMSYEFISMKEQVKEFVKQQLSSESPKTRKAAKAFLKKIGKII